MRNHRWTPGKWQLRSQANDCLAFLHRYFPPRSPPTHPLDQSLCRQQQPSTIPKLQLSAAVPSRGPASGYVCLQQGLADSIPFRLPQVRCSTLSLKCFSSDSDNCPDVGIGSLLQFSHPPRTGPVLLTLLFPSPPPPPSSFILLSFLNISVNE